MLRQVFDDARCTFAVVSSYFLECLWGEGGGVGGRRRAWGWWCRSLVVLLFCICITFLYSFNQILRPLFRLLRLNVETFLSHGIMPNRCCKPWTRMSLKANFESLHLGPEHGTKGLDIGLDLDASMSMFSTIISHNFHLQLLHLNLCICFSSTY